MLRLSRRIDDESARILQLSHDLRQYRNALGRFATGVTVITAEFEERTHGMTVNAFASVSLEPPLVLVSLDNRSFMHKILPGLGRFGISVLEEHQEPLSTHFAGHTVPGLRLKFTSREGVPLLENAVAYFVVRVVEGHPAGDHTLYICEVEYFEARDERPLLFFGGKYHRLRPEDGKPTEYPADQFSLFSIGSIDPPIT